MTEAVFLSETQIVMKPINGFVQGPCLGHGRILGRIVGGERGFWMKAVILHLHEGSWRGDMSLFTSNQGKGFNGMNLRAWDVSLM